MVKLKDETGNRYSRLVVIGRAENYRTAATWLCQCDCGEVVKIRGTFLRDKNTQSCGCLNKEAITKHGLKAHPLYGVWENIKTRIFNPKSEAFHNYGGRGIIICAEWLKFENFYAWAKDKWQEGLEIDRRDNDGNYEPGNCHFVIPSLNVINRRKLERNTSGYVGVCFHSRDEEYQAYLDYKLMGGRINLGNFPTKKAALAARNNFIVKNNLPHKLQEYIGE